MEQVFTLSDVNIDLLSNSFRAVLSHDTPSFSSYPINGFYKYIIRSKAEAKLISYGSAENNGISVYISATQEKCDESVLVMLGIHPKQSDLEDKYQNHFRIKFVNHYFVTCLLDYIKLFHPKEEEVIAKLLMIKQQFLNVKSDSSYHQDSILAEISSQFPPTYMNSLLPNAYRTINRLISSSLQNAYLYSTLTDYTFNIDNVYFQDSPDPKYRRIVFALKEKYCSLKHHIFQLANEAEPGFVFAPAAYNILSNVKSFVDIVTSKFWSKISQSEYVVSDSVKFFFSPIIADFISQGVLCSNSTQLNLSRGYFNIQPFSCYLHGLKGTGKSAFIRAFAKAMEFILINYFDPEAVVRQVYVHLNKSLAELDNEFKETGIGAPNNDKSVRSILASQEASVRCTNSSIIILIFEEVPDSNQQVVISKVLVDKLDRKYKVKSGGSSIISLFISNYILQDETLETFKKSKLWKRITSHEFSGINGDDLAQLINHRLSSNIQRSISSRNIYLKSIAVSPFPLNLFLAWKCLGDIRQINRVLDMVGYWIGNNLKIIFDQSLLTINLFFENDSLIIDALIYLNDSQSGCVNLANNETIVLERFGCLIDDNSVPWTWLVIPKHLRTQKHGEFEQTISEFEELMNIIKIFFDEYVFAPMVIVCKTESSVSKLLSVVSVDPIQYQMFDLSVWKLKRCLSDHPNTPTVRDQIKKMLNSTNVFNRINTPQLVIELRYDSDDIEDLLNMEFRIRDLIDDIPSSSSFSTKKSNLEKKGIMFICFFRCRSNMWTPSAEILSRTTINLP